MSKKKNTDWLMYGSLGLVGFVLLTKKKTTLMPVTNALPGGAVTYPTSYPSNPVNTVTSLVNPISSIANSIATIFKNNNNSGSSSPVYSSGNDSFMQDASNWLNLPPLQSAPLQSYGSSYNPFANAPVTGLEGFDTTCSDCFESVDDSISGVGIGVATPLQMTMVKPSTSVTDVIHTLVSGQAKLPVVPLVNPVSPTSSNSCSSGSSCNNVASAVNNSIKFTMPYNGNAYACCCNKGALIAGLTLGSM